MHQIGQVTTVIKDQVEGFAIREHDGLINAPDVLFICLALPGIDGHPCDSNGGSRVVLGGEDIAAGPLNLKRCQDIGCYIVWKIKVCIEEY